MRAFQRGFWPAVAVVILSAVLGGVYGPRVEATATDQDTIEEAIRKFTKVLAIVEQNYADPVDPDQAVFEGAIPSMLRTLDPHSNFFDSRAFSVLREEQRGRYYGVGMTVVPRDGQTVVVAPFPNSPAYKAGLRPSDVIHSVDGVRTEGMTTSEVADRLKGPKGTVVRVEVVREGHEEPLEFVVTRDEIPNPSVDLYFEIQPRVGYVRIHNFNENTHQELAEALEQMDSSTLKGLILDLRGNPGGLLNEAVAVSDMFLEKNQLIVSHRGRAQRERRYYAMRGNRGMEFPLVVMVDRQSASAAEIVAGAIQDHDRGLIVGETSFGKGLVQTVYPLSYNTGMLLTTSRYYTPSGRLIQRDFASVSLFDYFFGNKRGNDTRHTYATDSGRTVYGGGGITPDVELDQPDTNRFQSQLTRKVIIYPFEVGVGDFVRRYLARHENVPKDFKVNEAVLNEFRDYLVERDVRFTEPDIQENLDWLKLRIRKEVAIFTQNMDVGRQIAIKNDPQVIRALGLLTQAKQLAENARQLIARQREEAGKQ